VTRLIVPPQWIKILPAGTPSNESAAVYVCERCGQTRPIHLPASSQDFKYQGLAFSSSHDRCKPKDERILR
jgi:hypothetical protein